jgi:hypothetical protein
MAVTVLKATWQHSKNLALFVPMYKALLLIQKRANGREQKIDSFIAGLISGWIVFGADNPINNQANNTNTDCVLSVFAGCSWTCPAASEKASHI